MVLSGGPRVMKRALIINRIPKTGSTYLATSLKAAFCKSNLQLLPLHHWPHKGLAQYEADLNNLLKDDVDNLFIQGHLPLGALEAKLSMHNYITKTILVLREPTKRFRSHLSYFLSRKALIEDHLGQPRYLSHPMMSLYDIFVDHQYRWLSSFYCGLPDACSTEGAEHRPDGILSRLHSSCSSMNKFLEKEKSECILIAAEEIGIDKLSGKILESIGDLHNISLKPDNEGQKVTNKTPKHAVIASLSLIESSRSNDLQLARQSMASIGYSFSDSCLVELMRVTRLATRADSIDNKIYARVAQLANSSLGCYLRLIR